MKYIKKYQRLDEKISWNKFLLSLLIGYIGYGNVSKYYNEYKHNKEVHYLYNVVNSNTNYPTGKEKEIIEVTREKVIDQIKQSKLFVKFGKSYIVDSIKTATIKIVDTNIDIIGEDVAAAYIYLEPFTKGLQSFDKFKDIQSTKSNIILINRSSLEYNDLASMLTHEIYHYVDRLYDSTYMSKKLDLSKFKDNKLNDKEHLMKKLALLKFHIPYNKIDNDELKDVLSKFVDLYNKEDFEYLTKSEEIFARLNTLKGNMIESGIINSYNDKLTKLNVIEFALKKKTLTMEDFDILLILDLDKISELDELIS